MLLALDTSTEIHQLALYEPGKMKQFYNWRRGETSRELLIKIDEFLRQNKVRLKDLKAIAVFRGPGSYTGLRIGISTAQALGFALDIPVFGTTKDIAKDIEKIWEETKKTPQKRGPVKPIYIKVIA